TNAATHSINVLAGAGGPRTLGAQLDNQGSITTGAALGISKSSAHHTNSGSITVSGGDLTLTMNGTMPSFTQTGRSTTLDPGRTLAVVGGTVNFNGGTLGPSAALMTFSSATLALGAPLSSGSIGLNFSSATINGPSTLTNAAGVTVLLRSTTVAAPVDNFG